MGNHLLIIYPFLFLLFVIPLKAQYLDSLDYLNFYHKHINTYEYGDSLDVPTKIAGLSRAWAEARFNFSNFDQVPGLNWDSLYLEFIPKVINATSEVEFYKLLTRFYSHLNDGHSMIVAPFSLWDSLYAGLPIEAKLIDNQVVITKNHSHETQFQSLEVGKIIERINGMEIHDYIGAIISPYVSFTSSADSLSRIFSYHFTRGKIDEPIELQIISRNGESSTNTFNRLPQHQVNVLSQQPKITFSHLTNGIILIDVPGFGHENQTLLLDSIFHLLKPEQALIIDLRGNNSGLLFNAYELLSYLHQTKFNAETILSPVYNPLRRSNHQLSFDSKILTTARQPYWGVQFDGPVAILIDENTHGNAEIFLASLENQNNIHLIGSNTSGASGQSLLFRLPENGMGFVSTKRNLTAGRSEFYRIGFQADIQITLSLNQFLSDEDPVMDAAINFLENQLKK